MWEMIDSDFDIECGNECFGPGPPPEFRIPPPPRPPFLQEISKCTEEPLADFEMCQAIPILDASYHSSPSLQTSAMILLCSVLLLIFIFVSSILVWKHKRKVQNFLPCKTPTRGPLSNPGVPGGHSVTYEDPDMHLGHHRPLVMRHQLNVEMLHAKTIHYPSGYPMPRSPPLFICSSPGPDPYRSHDNVYEELEHRRYSDSEPQLHSDDDFAEDELSLPGDRSFNKTSPDNTTVATIYQGQGSNSSANETNSTYIERNRVERNSLLSSASSSANDNNVRPNIRNSSSSNESNHTATLNNINTNSNSNNISSSSNGNTGIFRFRTSRPNSCKNQGNRNNRQKTNNFSMDNLNTSTETAPATDDVVVVPSTYSNSSSNNSGNNNNSGTSTTTTITDPNCNTLSNSNNINNNSGDNNNNNNNNINNNNNNNSNNITHNGSCSGRNNYQTMDSESDVERRNRINAQLSNPTMSVATICRDRNIRYPTIANSNYYAAPPQQLMVHGSNINNNNNNQSRTNPRAPPTERRRNFTTNNSSDNVVNNNNNQEYLYQEPVFHEGMIYDPCLSYNNNRNNQHYHPYILPEFTTFRNNNCNNLNNPHQPLAIYGNPHGSDSGYSQNTQNSGSRSLWGRRKRNNNTIATTNRNETTTPYEGS